MLISSPLASIWVSGAEPCVHVSAARAHSEPCFALWAPWTRAQLAYWPKPSYMTALQHYCMTCGYFVMCRGWCVGKLSGQASQCSLPQLAGLQV